MEVKKKYNHREIEKKWQAKWFKSGTYWSKDMLKTKTKFYNLWMFPYPSAEGLHAGHAFSSTGSDVYGRYRRMRGEDVFQPIGYDSFGIHSENFALKVGKHPRELIRKTTKHYQKQMKSLGHGYDWTRTVTTSEPDYYRWTQWLFVEMFKAGLAYRKKTEVNWCPSCKTVLADEQVTTPAQAGKGPKDAKGNILKVKEGIMVCERCGTVIEKKELEQWHFRITDYADRLLEGLGKIDWPEKIKVAQRNWIGKRQGITITYPIKDSKDKIDVWTSRPDTNFGATFIVISPEYAKKNLVHLFDDDRREKSEEYIKASLSKSKDARIQEGRDKTGIFTGLYAINQLNGYEMPVWVADFVLYEVGTGAVVGVPGHDKRDFEFAKKFGLPIKRIVVGSDGDDSPIDKIEQVQEEEGTMVKSEFLNGLDIHTAKEKMMDYLEEKEWGKRRTVYHLRDWIISRQRYWGPPIPMIFCGKCKSKGKSWFTESEKLEVGGGKLDNEMGSEKSHISHHKSNNHTSNFTLLHQDQSDWDPSGWYPEENLPVELPDIADYQPEGTGKGPLAKHPEFYNVACPECGETAQRETDVSDTFLDSSWYHMRYPSVGSKSASKLPFDRDITKKWLPVDFYFGGAEHAVLHLMYARYVGMFFHDLGLIDWEEPYPRFYAHGLMIKDGAKMSKSRGNVVNPDEYIEKFGADTLRLYLMFLGPMDGYPDFRDTGIEGMRRFIERVWELYLNYKDTVVIEEKDAKEILIKMHQTIKKVSEDVQEFKYNTAISAIMEFINILRDKSAKSKKLKAKSRIRCAEWDEALKTLVLLLAPFAPHITEELWQSLRDSQKYADQKRRSAQIGVNNQHKSAVWSIHAHPWPKFNPELIKEDVVTIAVQVNGKLRGTVTLNPDEAENKDVVIQKTKAIENISKWLEGRTIKDTVFVPGKLLNYVL